ncbi:MAG: 2-pyrone-4,6-dicarboxylate hydrolase [Alphaproteobacteria bacterium]|nr:2-pyrone-4,6-dicarboxylate hydrolase [Alphaproteobacteria bacterium]
MPSVPRHRAPPGAVDCHHHVYDPRYAFIPAASYRPGPATADDYRRFRERLGLARSVVIQPSVYGTDNACTLDAVAQLGTAARAIVLIEDDTPRTALEAMARAGAVGVRLQTVGAMPGAFDRLERLAARVAELGWHLQLHVEPETIVDAAARLKRLRVPLVFDHFGRVPMATGASHPSFRVLADLVTAGRTWVKLSAGYHFSKLGPPAYEDVGALTRDFLALAPERMLWGTDWPHPTETMTPDAAIMLDRFVEWAGNETTVRRVLVDNPAVVYGFPAFE